MRATYNGDATVVFSFYLDVSKPEEFTTLVAEPGKTYEIKQADAPRVIQPDGEFTDQELAMPPSDEWAETDNTTWAEAEAKEAAEQAAKQAATPPPPKPEAKAKAEKKENG